MMNTAPIETLPRDLEHGGKWLTELYRSHREGGRIVYLENSEPGCGFGHKFHVFEIEVVNGQEQLGETLAVKQNCDAAIAIAGNA
jgi:hypothetical protein